LFIIGSPHSDASSRLNGKAERPDAAMDDDLVFHAYMHKYLQAPAIVRLLGMIVYLLPSADMILEPYYFSLPNLIILSFYLAYTLTRHN